MDFAWHSVLSRWRSRPAFVSSKLTSGFCKVRAFAAQKLRPDHAEPGDLRRGAHSMFPENESLEGRRRAREEWDAADRPRNGLGTGLAAPARGSHHWPCIGKRRGSLVACQFVEAGYKVHHSSLVFAIIVLCRFSLSTTALYPPPSSLQPTIQP